MRKIKAVEDPLKIIISDKVKKLFNKETEKINELNGKVIDYRKVGSLTEKIRNEILERDENTCRVCGSKTNLEIHHILKRRWGGGHTEDNLITLCLSCHRAIETRDIKHAINRCYKNAQKSLGQIKNNKLSNEQKVNSMLYALEKVFDDIADKDEKGEFTDSLILISNILDDIH